MSKSSSYTYRCITVRNFVVIRKVDTEEFKLHRNIDCLATTGK